MISKPLVCIWDLDGTLGWKTPYIPAVTKDNVDFIKYLNGLGHVSSIFATGRPRTQARLGLSNGGMERSEIYTHFKGGVFEDGLYVEDRSGKIYNAMDESKEYFKYLKKAMFDYNAISFFGNHGIVLFPDAVVKQARVSGLHGEIYTVMDYNNFAKKTFIISGSRKDIKGVIFEQGNDVRGTYKAPIGFMNDDVKAQSPFFDRLEPLVKLLLSNYGANVDDNGNIGDHSYLVKWDDSIELYPKLGDGAFRKDHGVEMLLDRIDPNKEATLVFGCDGKNDISLVDHLGEKYAGNYLVIAPSNLSPQLKTKFDEHNLQYGKKCYILNEDCTKFGSGALNVLKDLKYI